MDCNPFSHPRVLVVEDEPLLRMFNSDMLTDAGFDVCEASDADQALLMLEQFTDIRIVFTDVEMPGLIDGFDLAARIEQRWPDIFVLVASGRRLPHPSFNAPARHFMQKPYKVSQVLDVIGAFANHACH